MKIGSRAVVVAALVIATLATSACQTSEMGTKEGFGTVGGAVVGGLIGSRFGGGAGKLVAVGIGTLAGGMIGREIGVSLDRADRAAIDRAGYQAYSAPIGAPIAWSNQQSGNYGSVTPVREGANADGLYCREFQTKATVAGKAQQVFGTACRQPDGSWKVLDRG